MMRHYSAFQLDPTGHVAGRIDLNCIDDQDAMRQAEMLVDSFGLDHNESRSWHGWHRHVSMVMLAFAMMAVIRHHANPPQPTKTQRRTTAKTKPSPPRH